jgi:hypothetical protein
MNTKELLAERGKTHGDYSDHAQITQLLKGAMRNTGRNWPSLVPIQVEALEMIAHKIGRILSGDPNHQDHWDDIAGYAKLVSERLFQAVAPAKPPMATVQGAAKPAVLFTPEARPPRCDKCFGPLDSEGKCPACITRDTDAVPPAKLQGVPIGGQPPVGAVAKPAVPFILPTSK